MSSNPRCQLAVFLWAACLLLGGCGGRHGKGDLPTYPVQGRVLLNGRPLSGVLVVLHPLDRDPTVRSYGRTGADGEFTLSTYTGSDGAPAGRYAVTLLSEEDQGGPPRLPRHLASPRDSGLVVTVLEQENRLATFDVR